LHILIPFFHDIHTVFLHMQNCPPYVDKVVDNFIFFLFSFPGLLVSILQFLLKIGLFPTIFVLFSFIPSFSYYVDNFFFNLSFLPRFFTRFVILYPFVSLKNRPFPYYSRSIFFYSLFSLLCR